MLYKFLDANRAELIERCRAKVALRPAPRSNPKKMAHGIPLFLAQLIEALRAEVSPDRRTPMASPPPAEAAFADLPPRQIVADAAKHGHELLQRGFTVDQVVHDYGDLCQAVAELAIEKYKRISAEEFKTLNRCLDNAIAGAVTEYGRQRDQVIADTNHRAMSERVGFLAHELRNFLNTAVLAFAAVKSGSVGVDGPTARVIDRSLVGLRDLIDTALTDVRLAAGAPSQLEHVALDGFIAEVQTAADLAAKVKGCELTVHPVEAGLRVHVDKRTLYSATQNLLQNAFKFTRPHSHVSLKAYAAADRVLIEVADQCGGLPEGKVDAMFLPFQQHHADRTGLGLGLSIARRAVEASAGTLAVRDVPGVGCIFTIDLPRCDVVAADLSICR
jgi:signal transduction histidine kinase